MVKVLNLERKKDYRTFKIDIKKGHKLYPYFEELSLNSNNLYNTTNFYIRQVYTALNNDKKIQPMQQEILEIIYQNIDQMNEIKTISYYKKIKKEQNKPLEERKKIELKLFERYLPKGNKKEVVLSNQICKITDDKYLTFPKTKWKLNIGKLVKFKGKFQQVRIIPKNERFTVEVIYLFGKKPVVEAKMNRCMSIDLGVENIATLVFNTGLSPVLFKGGIIKSVNQWYNKLRSDYYAALRNGKNSKKRSFYSKKLIKLDNKRNNQIKDQLHKISCNIVKIAIINNIDTIIIGKSSDWKQKVELGTKNNQNFVQIPHSILISMITYKANAEGIAVIVTEESYTSKASILDEDEIPTYQLGNKVKNIFSGKRISRGMYCSKNKILLNADVNGAANILKKVIPNVFANGIAAVCSQPQVANVR